MDNVDAEMKIDTAGVCEPDYRSPACVVRTQVARHLSGISFGNFFLSGAAASCA